MDVSGEVVDVSSIPVVVVPPITLDDILATTDLLIQKEAADKATLDAIATMTMDDLKTRLVVWGRLGFPNAYILHTFTLTPPAVCSDGVTRTLEEYISFCSGKTIVEHVASVQAKIDPAIQVGFVNFGLSISLVVTKV